MAKDYDLPSNASSRVLMRFDLEAKAHVDGAMGNVAADAHDLAFSGDGKSLFYVHDDQLWRANADGTQARQITMGVGGVSHPSVVEIRRTWLSVNPSRSPKYIELFVDRAIIASGFFT